MQGTIIDGQQNVSNFNKFKNLKLESATAEL